MTTKTYQVYRGETFLGSFDRETAAQAIFAAAEWHAVPADGLRALDDYNVRQRAARWSAELEAEIG